MIFVSLPHRTVFSLSPAASVVGVGPPYASLHFDSYSRRGALRSQVRVLADTNGIFTIPELAAGQYIIDDNGPNEERFLESVQGQFAIR